MPITPSFTITQSDGFVFVKIAVPYVRVSAAEMICDGHDFSFYCHPYLLKLSFPCLLNGDDEEKCKAVYDPDEAHGTIIAHLPKQTAGEEFPDLDLTTLLLQKRKERDLGSSSSSVPSIEVISSAVDTSGDDADGSSVPEAEEEALQLLLQSTTPHYGFNEKYSKLFQSFREELVEMTELLEPDKVAENQRRTMRTQREDALFDPERYLGDLFGAEMDSIYLDAIEFEPFWATLWTRWKACKPVTVSPEAIFSEVGFSDAESQALKSLPNREYLIAKGSLAEREVLLGLVDILYAVCFEVRCTCGEFSVESPHNVTRLSSLLSWLDAYKSPDDCILTVITNACRRSLVYPYLRSWKLCRKVLADVAKVLSLGKRCVLKCLLMLHALYEHTDSHYMLNKCYIDDYCVWVQSLDELSLVAVGKDFNEAKRAMEASDHAGKGIVGFLLPELEAWAYEQDEGGEDGGGAVPDHLYPPGVKASLETVAAGSEARTGANAGAPEATPSSSANTEVQSLGKVELSAGLTSELASLSIHPSARSCISPPLHQQAPAPLIEVLSSSESEDQGEKEHS